MTVGELVRELMKYDLNINIWGQAEDEAFPHIEIVPVWFGNPVTADDHSSKGLIMTSPRCLKMIMDRDAKRKPEERYLRDEK